MYKLIRVEGPARERGRQYGASVASLIRQNIEAYLGLIEFHSGQGKSIRSGGSRREAETIASDSNRKNMSRGCAGFRRFFTGKKRLKAERQPLPKTHSPEFCHSVPTPSLAPLTAATSAHSYFNSLSISRSGRAL